MSEVVVSITIPKQEVTIEVPKCMCPLCRSATLLDTESEIVKRFTLKSYPFEFRFPRVHFERGGGDTRKNVNLDDLSHTIYECLGSEGQHDRMCREILRFITFNDFSDKMSLCYSLSGLIGVFEFLYDCDIPAYVKDPHFAKELLRRVSMWFVYSWHAFTHDVPEAEYAAVKMRKFLAFLISFPVIANVMLDTFHSKMLWPVVGPLDILEGLCSESLMCLDSLSLLCNMTRVDGVPKFLAEQTCCVQYIKESIFQISLTLMELNNHSSLLLSLLVNLSSVEGFPGYIAQANDGYLVEVAMLQLLRQPKLPSSMGMTLWSFFRNLCLSDGSREIILNKLDLFLGPILLPLAGPEEYPEEINRKLPLEVQYLDKNKTRVESISVRDNIIDILFLLCRLGEHRRRIRDCEAYQILKNYHLAETDPKLRMKLEDLVNVIIRTEDEIGVNDIMDALNNVNITDNENSAQAEEQNDGGDENVANRENEEDNLVDMGGGGENVANLENEEINVEALEGEGGDADRELANV